MGNRSGKCGHGRRKRINLKNTSPDVALQEFFRDNERFADVFNGCLFRERRRVAPEELREMDTNSSVNILSRELQEVLKRTRDVIKFTGDGTCLRILGIENQQHIHYAMPLRTMIYDALTYLRRAAGMIQKNRREKAYHNVDEFLSGMKKEDRLIPCYTIVIYWGENKWDGPRSLEDMMEFEAGDERDFYFQNYAPARLICVNEMEEYPFENKDVFQLFQAVHEMYQNAGRQMPETLQSVGLETAYTAAVVTRTTKKLEKALNETIQEGKESINMCEALKRAFMEERQLGRTEEKVEIAVRMLKEGAAPEMVKKCARLSEAQWQEAVRQAETAAVSE